MKRPLKGQAITQRSTVYQLDAEPEHDYFYSENA